MTAILGIDTAGPIVGAAIWTPDEEHSWSARVARGSDAVLIPAISRLLDKVDVLHGVAVSVGPGAFTGLRVGVATALGVAVSRKLRVVPVSSLEARAALQDGERVLALLDARKSRVYAQTFRVAGSEPHSLTDPVDESLSNVMPAAPFVAVGEGAFVDREMIMAAGGIIAEDAERNPAVEVARIGARRLAAAVEPGDIALAYLRPPDAQKIR